MFNIGRRPTTASTRRILAELHSTLGACRWLPAPDANPLRRLLRIVVIDVANPLQGNGELRFW